ncbi:SRPBCC family protein [Cohnella zeiphila]|uniref:SRPBCC domain-containing protein n=1 Tax=Cohnella zeiphila TaxID=2761120 RepID=A0A7X0SPR4_9BACL|nr:SRPBCC domain-containing protein [Cohnella zeiphila]MBB6733831.1 SRPBCC domain-containing protein [Cohnella zeiphila]
MNNDKTVGLTRTTGYQIGVRRTLPVARDRIWSYLLSPEGLKAWLGDLAKLELEPGRAYRTGDGSVGEVRVVKPLEQLRLTWQPRGWERASTVQIRLLAVDSGKTTVAFHQEHLDGPLTRARMKLRWEEAIDRMTNDADRAPNDE